MHLRRFIFAVCILAAIAAWLTLRSPAPISATEVSVAPKFSARQPSAVASELPKARPPTENAYAPKELADENVFRDAKKKRATPSASLKPLLSRRRWEIRGNAYSLMEDTVGVDANRAPKGIRPVGEAQGILLFNRADVEQVSGEKYLLLYEERYGRVVVLTGNLKVETDGNAPLLPAELTLAQAFPDLNLYFLKTDASSYADLKEKLSLAQSLPGVRNAVLDIVESRFVPK